MNSFSSVTEIIEEIPEETARVAFMGRHSKSVQGGENTTRTLRDKGIELCETVRPFYQELFNTLTEKFGQGRAECSEYPRSLLTTFLCTHAEQIYQNRLLNLIASVKDIENGEWYKEEKKKGTPIFEVMAKIINSQKLLESQPFLKNAYHYTMWIHGESKFKFTFAHEMAATLAADPFLPEEAIRGLNECQGYLWCLNGENNVCAVLRIVPPGTE